MPDVTLITPTGDRQQAFRLCEFWMRRQTYAGSVEWIVVDDGVVPTKPSRGQTHIRREPSKTDPPHTLCLNLRSALKRVSSGRVLIIEDDDYYSPEYVSTMMRWLDKADLVGEVGAKYYFVKTRQYSVFHEHTHASLCRTGFTRDVLPLVKRLARSDHSSLDMRLWEASAGNRYLHTDGADGAALSVSLKGMPGRAGCTHVPHARWSPEDDGDLSQLTRWMGEDHRYYRPFLGPRSTVDNLIVYTCSFGGYDDLKRQPVVDGVEYVAIVDGQCKPCKTWRLVRTEATNKSPRRSSRYPKIMCHEFFPGRTTLYIDATMRFLRDPREFASSLIQQRPEAQIFLGHHPERVDIQDEAAAIISVRFDNRQLVRQHLSRYDDIDVSGIGLPCGGVLLRRPGCERFNSIWWDEYQAGSMRDQMSLPYALHMSGVTYFVSGKPCPWESTPQWMTRAKHRFGRVTLELPAKPRMAMER
jgi:hypothetical protein